MSVAAVGGLLFALAAGSASAQDLVLRGATVMTAGDAGTLDAADVWVRDGRIAAVGPSLAVPAGTAELDARGRWLTPGIVDPHSHLATRGDNNETTAPFTPEVRIVDTIDPRDREFELAIAGGTTTQLILPGSANLIGGQGVVVKNRIGEPLDGMVVADAPMAVKFAIGENPIRTHGARGRTPASRMGSAAALRERFAALGQVDARGVRAGASDAPRRDSEADRILRELQAGRAYAHIHAYRAGEMETLIALAREAGFTIRAFHHATEAYKIGPQLAQAGIAAVVWSDWFGVKAEAWDAIPWNAPMLLEQGVHVALHSDSVDITRRMHHEAAKVVRYGATREQALRMVTRDAAWVLGLEDRIGSIEPGKDADLVLWSADPFGAAARVDAVYIDGQRYFDRATADAGVAP
ncbi:amidohydrolase family protein [Luteimonas abyssi]|uniref:amidohydrolase family protein n=1 Tax=Luteimonas abyssi TaxID=1247514 RepID=UPI0012FB44FB|nr:amidohydrolase family protein [Luteimonas abyssi]